MEKDIDFIKTPEKWPQWPILPVVHRRGSPIFDDKALGVIIDAEPTKVYVGVNLHGLTSEELSKVSTEEYATVEDLVKDWRVD